MSKMVAAMKECQTLTDEFVVCSQELVAKVNAGEITTRFRGNKKKAIAEHMLLARKKTVEVVKSTGIHVKEKFTAVSIDRYKTLNNGRCPKEDGMIVRWVTVPGEGRKEVVLIRKAPHGEWDMEVDASMAVLMKEQRDAGDVVLRATQQEDKFSSLSDTVHKPAQGPILDAQQYMQLQKEKVAPALLEDPAVSDVVSDDEMDMDCGDDLMSSILADCAGLSANKNLKKPAPSPSPSKGPGFSSGSAGSSSGAPRRLAGAPSQGSAVPHITHKL